MAKRTMTIFGYCVLAALSMGVACKKGGNTGGGAAGASSASSKGAVTVDDFCEKLFGPLAAESTAKCTAEDKKLDDYKMIIGFAGLPQKMCEETIQPGSKSGRMTFDAAAAQKCIDAVRSAKKGKDTGVGEVNDCKGVVSGKQSADQPCLDDLECKTGLYCKGSKDGKDGKCVAAGAKGEKCEAIQMTLPFGGDHGSCGAGLQCTLGSDTCLPPIAEGSECELLSDKGSCAKGLSCIEGKCRKKAAGGSACTNDSECLDGLWCKKADKADKGACAEKQAEGAPCMYSSHCKGRCDQPTEGKPGTCKSFCGSG